MTRLSIDRAALRTRAEGGDERIPVALSSEEPVTRWFGIEILDHTPAAIDLSRAERGLPLLDSHNRWALNAQLGIVEDLAVGTDRVLRGLMRFSKRDDAQAVRQDVLDGIISSVSIGYIIHEVLITTSSDTDTYRATRWELLEGSLLSVPADKTVGVGRSADDEIMRPIRIRTAPAAASTFRDDAERFEALRELENEILNDQMAQIDRELARDNELHGGNSRPIVFGSLGRRARAVATHEAGHAIACIATGVDVRCIELLLRDGGAIEGVCRHDDGATSAVYLAGAAAHVLFDGPGQLRHAKAAELAKRYSESDYSSALLARSYTNPIVTGAYTLERDFDAALNIVRANWSAIEAIVDRLVSVPGGRLSGEEIHSLAYAHSRRPRRA